MYVYTDIFLTVACSGCIMLLHECFQGWPLVLCSQRVGVLFPGGKLFFPLSTDNFLDTKSTIIKCEEIENLIGPAINLKIESISKRTMTKNKTKSLLDQKTVPVNPTKQLKDCCPNILTYINQQLKKKRPWIWKRVCGGVCVGRFGER